MDTREAYEHLNRQLSIDKGKFYSPANHLPTGAGLIFSKVRQPLFLPDKRIYATTEAAACVLSHECDLAEENMREFNQSALICPIIEFGAFVVDYIARKDSHQLKSFLTALGKKEVNRVMYFPPLGDSMPLGGILYFNQITHTHINELKRDDAILTCSLTAYGLEILDYYLKNHLFRPKSTRLSLQFGS